MITDLASLRTSVKNRIARDEIPDTDFDEFISLGEIELNQTLRLRSMETVVSLTLNSGTREIDIPAEFLEDINLRYTDNDFYLNRVELETLDDAFEETRGRPNFYAISDKIYFDTPADQTYSLRLLMLRKWDLFANDPNWLVQNYPNTYLYAALWEACKFTRNSEQEAKYEAAMRRAIKKANMVDGRSRRNTPMRVDTSFSQSNRRGRRFNVFTGY